MSFKVQIFKEDDGFWATVPALPGCTTEGDTEEELMANLQDAITSWLIVREEMSAQEPRSEGFLREEKFLVAA